MINYTKYTNIVRKSRWPPGFNYVNVGINPTTGAFPTSAGTAWDWMMEFGEDDAPTAALAPTADIVNRENDGSMELGFKLTSSESEELPEGSWRVEIVSYDENGERSVYPGMTGNAKVIGNWE